MKKEWKWFFVCLVLFAVIAAVYPFIREIDEALTEGIYHFAPDLQQLFIVVTDLGSYQFAFPILIVLIVISLYRRNVWLAVSLAFNLLGVRLANWLLKTFFMHERPQLEHLVEAGYYTFPSGHAMNTMGFFGFIGYLLWQQKHWSRNVRTLLVSLIALFIGLVGLSRVYLGVHYVFDVIAGFLGGSAWLVLSIILYKQRSQQ